MVLRTLRDVKARDTQRLSFGTIDASYQPRLPCMVHYPPKVMASHHSNYSRMADQSMATTAQRVARPMPHPPLAAASAAKSNQSDSPPGAWWLSLTPTRCDPTRHRRMGTVAISKYDNADETSSCSPERNGWASSRSRPGRSERR